jgi:hypothetical protein
MATRAPVEIKRERRMVPSSFGNYFVAMASAGGALIGLLFVAVSIRPERVQCARQCVLHLGRGPHP